jgi:hypothetical protein
MSHTHRFPHWFIASLAFLLSLLLTWWFIREGTLYYDTRQALLSCGIAGAKWAVHIAGAFLLLPAPRAWLFIRQMGNTCLTGSLLLLPYCIAGRFLGAASEAFFLISLVIAVAVMIIWYAVGVRRSGLHWIWWVAWLGTLALAIVSQLHFVFGYL